MSSSAKANRFTSFDFFSLAQWCHDTMSPTCPPAMTRTIINRAYYAALLYARDITKSSTVGIDGHKNVVKALKAIDSYAGNKLDSLRIMRHKADYEMSASISVREAAISIAAAREILFTLKCPNLTPNKPYTENYLDKSLFLPTN